jgi:hypothetical protein
MGNLDHYRCCEMPRVIIGLGCSKASF